MLVSNRINLSQRIFLNQNLKKIRWIISLVIILISFNSCDSFVDVDVPDSQLFEKTVFEDFSTANAAQLNLYATLRESSLLNGGTSGITYLTGHYADELELYNTNLFDVQQFSANNVIPANTYISSLWNTGYSAIYGANSIIDGVAGSAGLNEAERSQLQGEGLFTRALVHFYLVNLFGDIPYIATTDYRINDKVPRMPAGEVYEKMIYDLLDAQDLLTPEYPEGNRIRPNRAACTALLARAYLFVEDYENSALAASQVIGQSERYVLEPQLEGVFQIGSRETIWQFDSGIAGNNTIEALTLIFSQVPPPDSALSSNLLNSFEPDDLRKQVWINSLNDGMRDYSYSQKYRENGPTASSMEYSVVLRLAELYLIRAEARASLGDVEGALNDINLIRARAGLNPLNNLDISELPNTILRERQLELFLEFGHRWFDLKRLGFANEVLAPIKSGWETTDVLLPLPESELLVNDNLMPQNLGY